MTTWAAVLLGVSGAAAGSLACAAVERLPPTEPRRHREAGAGRPRSGHPAARRIVLPAVTAALFAALALRLREPAALPPYLYLAAVSVALAAVDIEQGRLPNVLTLPSYPVGLGLLAVAAPFTEDGVRRLGYACLGMAVLWACYALLFAVHPRGLGWGDVKLAGVCGMFLGWLGADAWAVGAFAAFVFGAAYGLGLVAARRASRSTAIPFGPFMVAGAFTGVFGGAELAGYLGL